MTAVAQTHEKQTTTWPESLIILAAVAVITAFVLRAEPLQSANDRSRWATVWSLVERRTFRIDEIDAFPKWSTIDKVRYRNDESEPWHFYSSKPPLLSVLVAALYAIQRSTLGYGLFSHTAVVTRLLLLAVNVLPCLLAFYSLTRCLRLLGASQEVRIFVLIVAGFGSILNPYLTTLNNHTPAVACAMFSITAAARLLHARLTTTEGAQRSGDFAALGFFSALTCCFELPAAQLGVLAFVAAAWLNFRKGCYVFLSAAAVPLAAFFITNWLATGGLKPFYATYGSETYVYEHNGIPSYWTSPRDLDANTESPHVYLFHCVLGHHGLLSLTPVLLLTVVGWFLSLQRREIPLRRVLLPVGLMMSAVTLGFYLTRTQNYNYGGNSVGLRWMLWLSPFWWIAMVPALERCRNPAMKLVTMLLLLVSVVSVSWSMDRPWRPSWLYERMEAAGWINYRTPVAPFETPRVTIFAGWPREAEAVKAEPRDVRTSAVWRNAAGERLIVTARPADESASLTMTFELESEGTRKTLEWDSADLRRILGPEALMRREPPWSESEKAKQSQSRNTGRETEWEGFRAVGSIWIPSAANPSKAWKVDRGAARVVVKDPVLGRCWHRCDVQYCDPLPFGVLQWKVTVSSESTGEVLRTDTWLSEQR